jgi:4-hydroxy-tetrahydrodipicolinate synthase
MDERVELMGAMLDEARGGVPVVAGVSSASLPDTLRLVDGATSMGADYLMIWPPIFGPRDEAGVGNFYKKVLEHTDLPCFVYSTHLEELGYYLRPQLIEALADRYPHVYGVKDGRGDVTQFLNLTASLGGRLKIGTPFEEYWIMAKLAYPELAADFLLGSSRAMYMQTPARPLLAEALNALRDGSLGPGLRALDAVAPLVELQMASFARGVHPIALAKFVLGHLAGMSSAVREPTPVLDDETAHAVVDVLAKLGLLPAAQSSQL